MEKELELVVFYIIFANVIINILMITTNTALKYHYFETYKVMLDLYEYSTPELVRLLGSRFKDYRLRRNLTQKEVAKLTCVGLTTIHKFESGSARNLSLGTFLLLLKAVGRINALDDLLPDLPPSPYLMKNEKTVQRIRHPKNT